MSGNSGLMDTAPGGEQTQYEGEHTDVDPPAKLSGRFGDSSQGTATPTSLPQKKTNEPNTQGITTADKIRFGQKISEEGMGGQTSSSMGEATTEGGFGGTKALDEESDGFAKERREQGYGGNSEMDRNIGA